MKAIIAAAGTGGHINPGIAIANEIMKNEPNSKIIFVGTPRGLENDLVPRAGYELKQIEAYGISRKINIENIRKTIKTIKSIEEAKKIIKEFKPDVVIGMGGYISVAVGEAAKKLKVPIVLHESNAYPGVSIKILSKHAKVVCVGFEDAKKRLPKAKKIVVTGNPSKIEKINYSIEQKQEKLKQLKLNSNLPIVLVFGGSQGARSINDALIDIIEKNLNHEYQIIWSAGKNNYEKIKDILKEKNIDINKIKNVSILPYIYNMEEMMNIADLVVCRSGAMTITEVARLGKPAIFIPFPFATENHQEYNAKVLVNRDAAKLILDKDLNSKNLNETINLIVKDKAIMKEMGEKAENIAKNNVEKIIYNEIKKEGK